MSKVLMMLHLVSIQYAKLREKKRKERPFKQFRIRKPKRIQENNEGTKNHTDGNAWYKYFSQLSSIPDNLHIKSKLLELKDKLTRLENINLGFLIIILK